MDTRNSEKKYRNYWGEINDYATTSEVAGCSASISTMASDVLLYMRRHFVQSLTRFACPLTTTLAE